MIINKKKIQRYFDQIIKIEIEVYDIHNLSNKKDLVKVLNLSSN